MLEDPTDTIDLILSIFCFPLLASRLKLETHEPGLLRIICAALLFRPTDLFKLRRLAPEIEDYACRLLAASRLFLVDRLQTKLQGGD